MKLPSDIDRIAFLDETLYNQREAREQHIGRRLCIAAATSYDSYIFRDEFTHPGLCAQRALKRCKAKN